MRFAMVMIVGLILAPCLLAEEKTDPRETVESALDHMITLMEKKDHVKLLKECYLPAERDKILQGTTAEELANKITTTPQAVAKSLEMIKILKEFKTKTPVYNETKTEAKFPDLEHEHGYIREGLTFVKEGNLWYFSEQASGSKKAVPLKSKE